MTFTAAELAILRAGDAVMDLPTIPGITETKSQRNARQSRESRERRREREGDEAYRSRRNDYERERRLATMRACQRRLRERRAVEEGRVAGRNGRPRTGDRKQKPPGG
jgi:hypothetical protein